jgi:hypothetical protein
MISKNSKYRQYGNNLLMLTLSHNAATVELATKMIAFGELKQSTYKKFESEFRRIHKQFNDQYKETLDAFAAELGELGVEK